MRHSTTTLFTALHVARGKGIGELHRCPHVKEFLQFLCNIDTHVSQALEIHLIMDNYEAHKNPLVKNRCARHPQFHAHFTPNSVSWLNMVERWLGLLNERQITRSNHRDTLELERANRQYLAVRNESPQPYLWTKVANEIFDSLALFCK